MRGRRDTPPFLSTVTSKGQITIPAAIARGLRLQRGDQLEVSVLDDDRGSVAFRPIRSKPQRRRRMEAVSS